MSAPGLLDRNGLVKGTDFLHFYTLGNLAWQGRGDLLYDMRAQAELTRTTAAASAGQSVRSALRPAGFALLRTFRPAALRLGVGRVAFRERSDFCFLLLRGVEDLPALHENRWTILVLAIAFPGFFHLLAWGQTSGIALLCFTLAYLALQQRSKDIGGIGHRIVDLQAAAGVGRGSCICMCARMEDHRRGVGGCLGPTSRGLDALRDWGDAQLLACTDTCTGVLPLLEPRLYQTHSLRSFWSLLLPWPHVAFAILCG